MSALVALPVEEGETGATVTPIPTHGDLWLCKGSTVLPRHAPGVLGVRPEEAVHVHVQPCFQGAGLFDRPCPHEFFEGTQEYR